MYPIHLSVASSRTTYHHGNLADEAISRALDAIECGGESKLSVRSLAESLGVAHRALYNHFGDREGLLAAMSARGFEMLASAVESHAKPAEFIRAYANFALTRPGLYGLMMQQSNASFDKHPRLRSAVDRMIEVSTHVLAVSVSDNETDLARRSVMRVWMLMHGGLALHAGGILRSRSEGEFVEELLAIAGFPTH